jgi:hypothetical protein
MAEPTIEDIAAMRADGSLREYFGFLAGRPVAPKPEAKPALAAVPSAGYRIAHTGGWPLGTAATGPTPTGDACTCTKCRSNPALRCQSSAA